MRISLIPKFSDLCFIVIFLLATASGAQMLSIDSDLGRHLALGGFILDNRIVPTRDLFSHTLTGESRPPYEWLSQVFFTLAYRLLQLDGVILLTASLIGVTALVVYDHSNCRSRSPLIALFVTLISAAATSLHWLPRPHVITFLFFAMWVNNLEQIRTGGKAELYIFPLTMLFWANLHGGFVFGFLAWGAYVAGWLWDRRRDRATTETGKNLFRAGVFSLAASIVTPDLWRNWEAALNNRSAFILSRTEETMRPDFSEPSVFPFLALLILSAILLPARWKTASASHVCLLAGLGLMSLLIARNIPLFAIAAAPILAELTSGKLNENSRWNNFEKRFAVFSMPAQRYLLPLAIVALAIGYCSYRQSMGRPVFQFNPRVFPVHAADWIESNPIEGDMFNEFNWGGYLLYHLPSHHVFLDSQSDFYGEELMREYEQIVNAGGNWQNLLDHHQVDWAIIPTRSQLAIALSENSTWETIYQDETAVIMTRR